jgi:hypothetical protein
VRMFLIDRDELGPETEADDGDANLLVSGHGLFSVGNSLLVKLGAR